MSGQESYWNSRVQAVKGDYGLGLTLNQEEQDFQRKYVIEGGDTLILGATPLLCEVASPISSHVTAVDFASKVIDNAKSTVSVQSLKTVQFIQGDWIKYLTNADDQFDTIVTDGGLLCLPYPESWEVIISLIHAHLRPNGRFIAKMYTSLPDLPQDVTLNPNLARFMTIPVNADTNWTVSPDHGDYIGHNVHYALPPKDVIKKHFSQFKLLDELTPSYPEGHRFLSFAWQK